MIFYYFFYFVCLVRFLFSSIFHSDFCLYTRWCIGLFCVLRVTRHDLALFSVLFVLRHLEKQQKICQKIEMDHAYFLSTFDISFFALDHFIIFISISNVSRSHFSLRFPCLMPSIDDAQASFCSLRHAELWLKQQNIHHTYLVWVASNITAIRATAIFIQSIGVGVGRNSHMLCVCDHMGKLLTGADPHHSNQI